ncbi:hypothetical protein VHEMI10746 [[Torrubiella] hemipterigena]|uniref:Reverse transcriptase domain-containing protein n=2 Tax=[Torrubiella] hemipterigena TaxID=1531966 RepID=A0A0A1TSF1_9HYPO|nr:hypothetical protein VHEMI10746 [[Torrubiella] hemipterigena]
MQLDIAGAFDAMPHECLLEILAHLGADPAALNLISSFLDDRSTYLVIDGVSIGLFRLRCGSPQGSPISPILFILYILILYYYLSNIPGIQLIGFSDDSNIVAIAPTYAGVVRLLEEAWTRCASWADAHGATFAAAKTTITHFTRAHSPLTTSVQLGPVSQPPTEAARFLGFYFHRKLTWEYHAREAKARAARAAGALSGTGRMAWGTRLENARLIYTMVHRAILTYRSVLFHKPGDIPLGPARTMSGTQHDMLRLLAGAFRATPAHHLEAELQIPPLHLYMTYRSERSLARFKNNGTLARVRAVSAAVAGLQRLPRRQRYRRPLEDYHRQYSRDLLGAGPALDRKSLSKQLNERWQQHWLHQESTRLSRRSGAQGHRPSNCSELPPRLRTGRLPAPYRGGNTPKHISSLVLQIRTGKISLNDFLFSRRVPDLASPLCRCGSGRETVFHMILHCELYDRPLPSTEAAVRRALDEPNDAARLARWLLDTGRIGYLTAAHRAHDSRPGQGTTN